MSEIEELIYKVTVELNEDDLQKAKKKVQELKETAKEAGIKIGVPTTDWSQASGGTRWPEEFAKEKESQKREEKESKRKEEKAAADEMATTSKEKAQSSKSISSTLSSSEQHLSNILDILRKLYRINSKKSENKDLLGADSDDDSKGFKIPKGGVAGFALEAIKTVGGFIIDAVKLAITAAQKLTDMIVDKNARELNLYKLSDQTDMSVKSLYRLKYVSETLGTSLEEVIGSAKNMLCYSILGSGTGVGATALAYTGFLPSNAYVKIYLNGGYSNTTNSTLSISFLYETPATVTAF